MIVVNVIQTSYKSFSQQLLVKAQTWYSIPRGGGLVGKHYFGSKSNTTHSTGVFQTQLIQRASFKDLPFLCPQKKKKSNCYFQYFIDHRYYFGVIGGNCKFIKNE